MGGTLLFDGRRDIILYQVKSGKGKVAKNDINIIISVKEESKKQFWFKVLEIVISGAITLLGVIASKYLK